jgi:hypothetical protein
LLPTDGVAGKVLGLTDGGTPSWVDQPEPKNSYMTPDYAQMSANKIAETGGSWTVSELGWVYLQAFKSNGTGNVNISINGRVVTSSGNSVLLHELVAVSPGDIIKIALASGAEGDLNYCVIRWFPPKYSTPPTPVVVDSGPSGSYLLNTEIQTADKWTNDRAIYKRTYQWTGAITSTTTAVDTGITLPANFSTTVRSEVVDPYWGSVPLNVGWYGTTFRILGTPVNTASRTYTFTVYYTKTTTD